MIVDETFSLYSLSFFLSFFLPSSPSSECIFSPLTLLDLWKDSQLILQLFFSVTTTSSARVLPSRFIFLCCAYPTEWVVLLVMFKRRFRVRRERKKKKKTKLILHQLLYSSSLLGLVFFFRGWKERYWDRDARGRTAMLLLPVFACEMCCFINKLRLYNTVCQPPFSLAFFPLSLHIFTSVHPTDTPPPHTTWSRSPSQTPQKNSDGSKVERERELFVELEQLNPICFLLSCLLHACIYPL